MPRDVSYSNCQPDGLMKAKMPLHAAKRELLEETGYSARSWKRVLHFWASPGFVAEAMSIYLARNLRAGAAQPEDDEVIELKLVPLEKAVSMVLKGTIQDAKTIAGVLWLDQQTRKSRTARTLFLRGCELWLSLHFLTLCASGRKMAIRVGHAGSSDLQPPGEVRGSTERNCEVVQ